MVIFRRIVYGLGLCLLILLGSVYISYRTSHQLYSNYSWIEMIHQRCDELKLINLTLTECEANVRGYALSSNMAFVQEYRLLNSELRKQIQHLERLPTGDDNQLRKIRQLHALLKKRIILLDSTILLQTHNLAHRYQLADIVNRGRLLKSKINLVAQEIQAVEETHLRQQQRNSYAALQNSTKIDLIAALTALAIAGLIGALLYKELEQQKNIEAELRALNQNKNRFFSVISHDLRAPVNNIVSLVKLLREDKARKSKPDTQLIGQMLESAANKASALLENLLIWANTQMDQIQYQPEGCDLFVVVEECLAVAQPAASLKSIQLTNQLDNHPMIYADRNMLATVIRNLLSNAIKFSRSGEKVWVSANYTPEWVQISVGDTGIGMSQQEIQKIFNLDTKYSRTGTAGEQGAGIGLLLCKEFVEKHGGEIWVESEVSVGSSFIFTLPASPTREKPNLFPRARRQRASSLPD